MSTSTGTSARDRLHALGLTLPPAPSPMGAYVPWRRDGATIWLAGQGPKKPDAPGWFSGKVGRDVTAEEAREHAKWTGLQLLAALDQAAGGLDRVEFVKVFGLVNAVEGFERHPHVIDGASELFVAVLGERGRHARSAVGVASLPMNITVEIEAVARLVD